MLIGYMRVSKTDGSQALDLQRDALLTGGANPARLHEDHASGKHDRRPKLPAKLSLAQAAMGRRETKVGKLCLELGITRQTLYRHVDPQRRLRPDGEKLLCQRLAGQEQSTPALASGTGACERHG
ncbi:recombinase family protein [Falsiroseomonas sp. E2-1-a20]|uniref:recombinase family protein n=1 Tax=Falsiroseomonas sp. E2-1-a20 TaxID=3239300 RepID=UPI003F37BCF7